jgi:trans-aconitate 2-methyltransferase
MSFSWRVPRMWDATQYLRYGDERGRPFLDLIARVGADAPSYVVDLGCGPGNLTAVLARRWPRAEVIGVDSSPEMIQAASVLPEAASVSFQLSDVRNWRGGSPPDVITCNAVLQWVPDHHGLVVGWADMLAPRGWLAFQLPGNFSSATHVIAAELAASPRWRALLAEAELNRQAGNPGDYVDLLARPGYAVDAWETTYHHILPGDNAVVEWTKGTTLRPALALLDPEQAASFIADYTERLRGAYKTGPFGTIFPFRRVFTVAHRI